MNNSSIHECVSRFTSLYSFPKGDASSSHVGSAPAIRPDAYYPAPPALLTHTIPDAQLDGIEFGNPVMMQRQKWADDMAMDRSRLPSDAQGVGIYSSHWYDNNGFTWQGNAALIEQDEALRALRAAVA